MFRAWEEGEVSCCESLFTFGGAWVGWLRGFCLGLDWITYIPLSVVTMGL